MENVRSMMQRLAVCGGYSMNPDWLLASRFGQVCHRQNFKPSILCVSTDERSVGRVRLSILSRSNSPLPSFLSLSLPASPSAPSASLPLCLGRAPKPEMRRESRCGQATVSQHFAYHWKVTEMFSTLGLKNSCGFANWNLQVLNGHQGFLSLGA